MELAICLAIFGFAVSIVVALYMKVSKQDLYRRRLQGLKENKQEAERQKISLSVWIKNKLAGLSVKITPQAYMDKIQAQLIRAGIPLKTEEYISLCLAIVLGLPLLMVVLSSNPWIPIMTAGVCALFPSLYLNNRKEKRLQALNQQLGDALVVMANALRAGFGFQQAMDTVRRELPPPISSEFTWTIREMTLGFSHEEALKNMSHRVNSEDLDMVITGIIIQRQVGGNLAEILENISETIRERARIKREIKILTAQGRLSGLIIGLLPVGLIAIMLAINPAYFTVMIKDPRGITVIVTAAILEIFGIFIISKIIDIDL